MTSLLLLAGQRFTLLFFSYKIIWLSNFNKNHHVSQTSFSLLLAAALSHSFSFILPHAAAYSGSHFLMSSSVPPVGKVSPAGCLPALLTSSRSRNGTCGPPDIVPPSIHTPPATLVLICLGTGIKCSGGSSSPSVCWYSQEPCNCWSSRSCGPSAPG